MEKALDFFSNPKKKIEDFSERGWRTEIYKETKKIIVAGQYSVKDKTIMLPEKIGTNTLVLDSSFYLSKNEPEFKEKEETKFCVIKGDCLLASRFLQKIGFNPVCLNMASEKHAGGGVEKGAGAQEENVFRRSNYCVFLKDIEYPLSIYSGVYSPEVFVFRDSETKKYELLTDPYSMSFIAVPACRQPELTKAKKLKEKFENITIEKMKTIYSLAAKMNHDCVVLSAFGCGAFRNPPVHIAQLFKEVFQKYFQNTFKCVAFAIIDDKNSNNIHKEGNVQAFEQVYKNLFELDENGENNGLKEYLIEKK